jgi:hypothetical protein
MRYFLSLLIIVFFVPQFSFSQLQVGDYYLVQNYKHEKGIRKKLVIKVLTDSTYTFLNGHITKYRFNNDSSIIDFPLFPDELSVFSISRNKIAINSSKGTYYGYALNDLEKQEQDRFQSYLIRIDIPIQNDADSLYDDLKGIITWKNSFKVYLSNYYKSHWFSTAKECYVQFNGFISTVCNLDNYCSKNISRAMTKDLFFKDKLKDHQLGVDFIFILYIDRDVAINDINAVLKAARKIDDLTNIYFAVQKDDPLNFDIDYLSIPVEAELNSKFDSFERWVDADENNRFVTGPVFNIVE